jgi:hypothetical protein
MMISFSTTLRKFRSNKEKTGWTYIEITSRQAQQLKPDTKVSFRVKGLLDSHSIQKTSLLPSGDGNFILPFNAAMRKGTGKNEGDKLKVQIELDERKLTISGEFMRCLKDEPAALVFFKTLPKSHQNYFGKWIDSAKTKETKANRIAMAVIALGSKQGYAEMIRANKKAKD